eukprot:Nk52_evm52s2152 gene=Nk52_evmTU52s2152
MTEAKICLVTGANKGIGKAIVQKLVNLPKNHQIRTVLLGSRDVQRGEEAVKEIKGSEEVVQVVQVDLLSDESIITASSFIKDKFGGLDILVNNAGFAYKNSASEPFGQQVEDTIKCNYEGTRNLCEKFLPIMKENGKIINVSSLAGKTRILSSDSLKKRILADDLSCEALDTLLSEFKSIVTESSGTPDQMREKLAAKGWPMSAYGISKLAVSAYTRILAKDKSVVEKKIQVNAMCPGWCKSDMAGWERPPKTAEEGADVAIYVATLPGISEQGPSGCFFENSALSEW